MPSAFSSCSQGKPAQLAGSHDRAEHADRGSRMKAALAQVGVAGTADRDLGFIARDHRLDQRGAGDAALVAQRQQARNHHAARMHRALPKSVVELDPVGGGAAEERGIEEIGAPGAARHRNTAGRAHRCEHRLGAVGDVAAGAGDHHADGVEQMASGIVADFVGESGKVKIAHEGYDRIGRASGGMARLQSLGMRHDDPLTAFAGIPEHFYAFRASFTRASTATTPSPSGNTISGLISASAIAGSCASCDSATIVAASASRSPLRRPR